MNTTKEMPQGAVRPLTAKQQRFVLALLEGKGKSEAYRLAYRTSAILTAYPPRRIGWQIALQ
jgi:hypothetical protein